MRIATRFVVITLCSVMHTTVLAHMDSVPDDYPSHEQATDCTGPGSIEDLQKRLQEYNISRVQVSEVLYSMADSYKLEGEVREGLVGFAEHFKKMGTELPAPDPGSDEFRNFDFEFGLSLTAVTVYLNTRDESLTEQFQADQKNPDSELGTYLATLDVSRDAYLAGVENLEDTEKTTACS
jgi:hypothetical protein